MYYAPYPYPIQPNYYIPWTNQQPIFQYSSTTMPSQTHLLYREQNPFPPVNIEELEKSAKRFKQLMQQAQLLMNRITQSDKFAYELMNAAQLSNKQKVDELIKSVGITINVSTEFSPTGIRIILKNSEVAGGCCDLLIALRW